MLLKKQTVWLLTMLSLVVVLSVYYVTSPENKGEEFAFGEDKETSAEEKTEGTDSKSTDGEMVIEDTTETGENGAIISSISSDEIFETIRIEMDASRSEQVESLQTMMTSTDISAEKKSEAYDRVLELQQLSSKERVLETFIKAMSSNFKDVLVRAEGERVTVTVKSDQLSRAEANKIIQTVKTELGKKQVAVEFSAK